MNLMQKCIRRGARACRFFEEHTMFLFGFVGAKVCGFHKWIKYELDTVQLISFMMKKKTFKKFSSLSPQTICGKLIVEFRNSNLEIWFLHKF